MNKKQIIMISAAGLVSFTGTFIFAWLTGDSRIARTTPTDRRVELDESTVAAEGAFPPPIAGTMRAVGDSEVKKGMTGKQLKGLVYEVREKIEEYNDRLQELESCEQRLQMAQDMLRKDTEDLDNLRIEVASAVANLKEEHGKLLKSRIEISRAEKASLISIAAAYDKMDAASAGKILTNMSKMQDSSGGSGFDDAVKILHCMGERTKAKLLAELVTSEPKLAAVLCQRLKEIVVRE